MARSVNLGVMSRDLHDMVVPAGHGGFGTVVGKRSDDRSTVRSTGAPGTLLNGPWMTLMPGRYSVEWFGSVDAPGPSAAGFVDVIFLKGKAVVARAPLGVASVPEGTDTRLASIDFELTRPTDGLEFRVIVKQGVLLTLKRVRVRRRGTGAETEAAPGPNAP